MCILMYAQLRATTTTSSAAATMPQGPSPSPSPSPPLPFSLSLPVPLAQANVLGLDSLDLFLQDTAGPLGAVGPGNPTDAFQQLSSPGTAEQSHLMTLLDSAMLGAFEADMAIHVENTYMETGGGGTVGAGAAMTGLGGAAGGGGAGGGGGSGGGGGGGALDGSEADSNNGDVTVESIARAENQFNTASNNVPGAGPMPPGTFGQMGGAAGAGALTEFTKRRNWPAKVVEELKDVLQILDANGRIKYVSPSITGLAGYSQDEVRDVFLKDLIHPDDQGVFVAELNESIASGNPLRIFYRLKRKDGAWTVFEAVGHAHIGAARFAPNPNNQSPFCQAVFMMARLYPTKNAFLLDSFLEHKIENERLKRRIAELRREEEAEADEAYRHWVQSQEGRSDVTPSEDTGGATASFHPAGAAAAAVAAAAAAATAATGERSSMMPMPAELRPLNTALTRENLEGAAAGNKQDSLRDKMERYEATAPRYEATSHTDTIEMLTGLRYVEGERSRGITTGNASPMLIKGDAGIRIPADRDARHGDKKKKLKTAEEYVCTDCGTLDSPEWRKGPSGPKTLCNACGLRWAKKEKKRNGNSSNAAHQRPGMPDSTA